MVFFLFCRRRHCLTVLQQPEEDHLRFSDFARPITDTTPVVDTSGGTLKLSEVWKKHIRDN
jgi:hypothetical protein